MTDLRTAAQQALEQVQEFKRRWWLVPAFGNKVNKATREAITNAHSPIFELEHALRAALEKPQENIIEAVRVQIMQTAYDCADNGEYESFNAVKVLCTDVLQILSRMGRA